MASAPTFILYHKETCPYCVEFKKNVLEPLKATNLRVPVKFVEQDIDHPDIREYLDTGKVTGGGTPRNRIKLRTVPHLVVKNGEEIMVWNGPSGSRNLENVKKFIMGDLKYAVKV